MLTAKRTLFTFSGGIWSENEFRNYKIEMRLIMDYNELRNFGVEQAYLDSISY